MKSIFGLIIVALLSSNAYAKPGYMTKFKTAYPATKTLHSCVTCHNPDYSRNDYGKDFGNNNHDLKAIEGFDSDADGFTNIVEINAGTFPGNRDSHPAK